MLYIMILFVVILIIDLVLGVSIEMQLKSINIDHTNRTCHKERTIS